MDERRDEGGKERGMKLKLEYFFFALFTSCTTIGDRDIDRWHVSLCPP